jgi:hypothetical protein
MFDTSFLFLAFFTIGELQLSNHFISHGTLLEILSILGCVLCFSSVKKPLQK